MKRTLQIEGECKRCGQRMAVGQVAEHLNNRGIFHPYCAPKDKAPLKKNPPLAGYSGKKTGREEISRFIRIEAAAEEARQILTSPPTLYNRDRAVAVLARALES